jgi:hypothetical protein
LQQKYGVKAYPTLLFINPEGEEMHRAMGFIPAEKLINAAKKASDPNWCSGCILKRLKSGERTPELIRAYFAGQQESQQLQAAETEAFFATVPDADFASRPFWQLVYDFVGGASTVSGKRLMALRNDFAKATTSDSLEMKIATMHSYQNIAPQQQNNNPTVLLQKMQDLRKQASEIALKNPKIAQDVLDTYDIEIMPFTQNNKGLCEAITRNFKSIFTAQDTEMQWNIRLYRTQTSEHLATDPNVLVYHEKWTREAYALKPDHIYSNLFLGKTLKRAGKNDEAKPILQRALVLAKKDNMDTKEIETLLSDLK